jgi:hypothetical protein
MVVTLEGSLSSLNMHEDPNPPSLPLVAKPCEKAPIRSRKQKSLGKDIIP